MELKQRRLWDRRDYKLTEKGLFLHERNPKYNVQTTAKYEDLGLEINIVMNKHANWIFTVLILLCFFIGKFAFLNGNMKDPIDFSIALSCFGIAAIILCCVWYEQRKTLISIVGGRKIVTFLIDSPSKEKVNEFIAELQNRIQNRLIEINVKLDDDDYSIEEKKYGLKYLKENYLISNDKYNETLIQIENSAKNSKKLGF